MRAASGLLLWLGAGLARYLSRRVHVHGVAPDTPQDLLLATLSSGGEPGCVAEAMHIRHYSLFAPRDFDVSPYFQIVKPWLAQAFDYRNIVWDDLEDGGRRQAASQPRPMDPSLDA